VIITLTTDFGWADAYVGAMKGVILSIAPRATLVDISHEIAPGDVRQAAHVLADAAPFFPAGTIHVAVVDPGVGGARRAIAARAPQAAFVAPDNGVLSLCLRGAGSVEYRQLLNSRYHLPRISFTFHGRDIFAPVAAHLAAGADFDDLGPPVNDPLLFSHPPLTQDSLGRWIGQVWHIDRFGNLITNFKSPLAILYPGLPARAGLPLSTLHVEIAGRRIVGLARAYAERAPGELLALVGSSGYLEIAVRDGSAARLLDAHTGDEVMVWVDDEPQFG
jgi:hypothetical protein